MQLKVLIPLLVVFLCVADSSKLDMKQFYRSIPTTVDSWSPMPTSEYPDQNSDEYYEDWPYAMMEFANLIGKCFMAKRMPQSKGGLLSRVCPRILEEAKLYADCSETMKEAAEAFAEESFELLQCVNLLAVKDSVKSVIGKIRPEESRPFSPGPQHSKPFTHSPGVSMPSDSGKSRPSRPGHEGSMPFKSDSGKSRPFRPGFGESMPSEIDSGEFKPFKFGPGKKTHLSPENEEFKPEMGKPDMGGNMKMAKELLEGAKELFQRCEETFPDVFGSLEEWETEFESKLKPEKRSLSILKHFIKTKFIG